MKLSVSVSLFIFFVVMTSLTTAGLLSGEGKDDNKTNIKSTLGSKNIALAETVKIMDEALVSEHNTKDDCWIIIDENVYDISSYFGTHPGGDEIIIPYCGGDGSEAFKTKDQKTPRDHSSFAHDMLKDFFVGGLGSEIKVAVAGKSIVDTDNDGLSDEDEIAIYKTDPNNPDTDGDGYSDGVEVENGYDPNGANDVKENSSGQMIAKDSGQNVQNSSSGFSLAEVAKHDSKQDCWLIMDGSVYDVSDYFGKHPGGDAIILPYCGEDGTTAFSTKGKKNPSNHSKFAYDLLVTYYIGDLSTGRQVAKSNNTVVKNNDSPAEPKAEEVSTEEEVIVEKKESAPVSYIAKFVISQVENQNIGELIYEIIFRSDYNFSVKYILDNNDFEAIVDRTGNVISTTDKGAISNSDKLKDIAIHKYSMDYDKIVSQINNNYFNVDIYKIEPKVSHRYVIYFYSNSKKYTALVDSMGKIEYARLIN